jgi:hypothetical protein
MSAWLASIETSDQRSWRRANAAVADARTPLPARLSPANGSLSRARTTPLIGSTTVRASSARRRVSSNSTISCDESLPSRLLPSHCSVRARTSPPPTRRRRAPTTRSRRARRCSPIANGCGAPPRTPTRASFATRRPCGRRGTRRNEDWTGASARPQAGSRCSKRRRRGRRRTTAALRRARCAAVRSTTHAHRPLPRRARRRLTRDRRLTRAQTRGRPSRPNAGFHDEHSP